MIPTISVVIPVYNRFDVLVASVESVLGQTVPVHEVLIVDDGSEDETPQKVPLLISERPMWKKSVRYIRQENCGQSVALNRGISEATGEWIAFSANDDLWLPAKLEWQLRALDQHGPETGLCFTDAWFMNNPHMKGNLWRHYGCELPDTTGVIEHPAEMIAGGKYLAWVQSILVRTELVRRAGGFDTELRYLEDQDFLFRIGLLTKFCYVSMPMVLIDRSPAEIRHVGVSKKWHDIDFALRMDQRRLESQWLLCRDLSTSLHRQIRRNLMLNQSHWANYFLERREFDKAREAMRKAIRMRQEFRIWVKLALVMAAPGFARFVFLRRDKGGKPRHDRTSWQTNSGSASNLS